MGLGLATNVPSMTAHRNLLAATAALNRNFEHLSTGRRIARASDDAAGMAISARLTARIRSINQAARNANDGNSLVQTAESGLEEIQSILVRMRELSVQSANGTYAAADRDALQDEFAQLQASVDQIAQSTSFNGIDLLNTSTAVTLHVGPDTIAGLDTVDVSLVSATTADLTINTLDIGSTGNTSVAINSIDAALDAVTSARAGFGALQNRLATTAASLTVRSENLAAANSRILDVDIALETAALIKNDILQQATLSVLAQANSQPTSALALLG